MKNSKNFKTGAFLSVLLGGAIFIIVFTYLGYSNYINYLGVLGGLAGAALWSKIFSNHKRN